MASEGWRRKRGVDGRLAFTGAAAALLTLCLGGSPAGAQSPSGMIPYDHPVYHHGVRVLWHGRWRNGTKDADGASGAKPNGDPKTPSSYGFTVFADGDDVCATRMATDIVAAVSAGGQRARPTVGRTAEPALAKLAGNDIADFVIAPVDALTEDAKTPWRDKSPYVMRLAEETIELVAGKSIAKVSDLEGRRVAVGPTDSADEAVAASLFSRLGVKPKFVEEPLANGLNDLAAGKVEAVVATGEAGSKALGDFGKQGGFALVPLPISPALRGAFAPTALTAAERPNLIASGAKVYTLAAPMALIAMDASPDSVRAQRDAAFVGALFDRFSTLVSDKAAAPDWRDVNLAATLDWPRLASAQTWVQAHSGAVDDWLSGLRSAARAVADTGDRPNASGVDRLFKSLTQERSAKP